SGQDGVLAEIALLEGDYARRLYYNALLDVAHPNAAGVMPVLTGVADRMRSDYDRSQVLQRVVSRVTLDERAAGAYVRVVDAMRSDYERRRSLTALLHASPSAPAVAALAVRSAGAIRSDYDRSQVLRVALGAVQAEPSAELFAGVGRMSSSYEKRQVL